MGTAPLLFCVAAEAKPFVRKVLQNLRNKIDDGSIFLLVESHTEPSSRESFRQNLEGDETFETDFIGASEQDCQKWAEEQYRHNFIEQDLIAIADKRSAADGTLLMQRYSPKEPALDFGRYGVLPREREAWIDFRIDYRKAFEVYSALQYGPIDAVYIVYFALKKKLTDEHGVFDVDEAERLVRGEDPEILEFSVDESKPAGSSRTI